MATPTITANAAAVQPVDFRRPNRVSREAVVALESQHETFARRLASVWNTRAHALVEVNHVSTDQLAIDDFAQSLAVPTALVTARLERLATTGYVQIDLPIAMLLVERLLGGRGDPALTAVSRRPTELEAALLTRELIEPTLAAVDELLAPLDGEASQLVNFDTTPQPLRLASPSELLLVFTFNISLHGDTTGQGLLSLAYPVGPLLSHLDQLVGNAVSENPESSTPTDNPLNDTLLNATVSLQACLHPNEMSAAAVAGLQPGDVLRLDHRADEPATLLLADLPFAAVYLGRRGRKVAVQVHQLHAPSPNITPPPASKDTP